MVRNKEKKIDLLEGQIDSTLRRFSIPLVLSFLIGMIYSWIDMFYVSRLGTAQMAAVGVSEQLLFLGYGIGLGFSFGTSVIVARRFGEGEIDGANRTATLALLFTFVFSIAISIVLFFSIPFIFEVMGIKGNVARLAEIYLSAMLLGFPFEYMIFQINAVVRAGGNSVYPMKILILSSVLNAVLAPFFVFGIGPFPRMEIFGAGLATSLSLFLTSIVALVGVLRKYTPIELVFKNLEIDWSIIIKIIKLGVPASLQFTSISLNRIALSSIANSFGTVVLTTYMLGLRVDLFVFMSIFAVGTAIEIITGQNLGAGQLDRIFKFHRSALKQLSAIMILLGLFVFWGGGYFAQLFTQNTELINEVGEYLKINAFSYLFFAVGIISTRVISGAGDYYRSLRIVVLILFIVQLPLAYILSQYTVLDYKGIWYSILASQIIFSGLGLFSLERRKWVTVKV